MTEASDISEAKFDTTSAKTPTRRDVLKLLTAGAFATIGLRFTPDMAVDAALAKTPNDLNTSIPTEFGFTEIPKINEFYKEPEDILREAFDTYSEWAKEQDLPPIKFQPRANYFSIAGLTKRFPRFFEGDSKNIAERLARVVFSDTAEKSAEASVKQETFAFSAFSINGVDELLQMDPGSGIVEKVVNHTLASNNLTRELFYKKLWEYELSGEILESCRQEISKGLLDAKRYFQIERGKQGKPLPLSQVIAYFLHQNRGDLYQSMWDSTLFLKMLARNNLYTLEQDNSYENAVEIGRLFRDEFAPHLSHNWLVDKFTSGVIPPDSPLYSPATYVAKNEHKDFMPINTAGIYYHGMNIITLASVCMDPLILETGLVTYYNEEKIGGIDRKLEHGKEKITADVTVAMRANQIRRVVDKYVTR